ncbi:unnamed protein product [Mytilus coruscus]|uniref:UMOD/GP2/OIT3-like D8C domain-containing protein n=1 Tax=Mytilus coruscus TaxID=42192 RepID=A0A6J8DSV9_MYTCO|nr:unnamed protein product [Mytilus coruscus]
MITTDILVLQKMTIVYQRLFKGSKECQNYSAINEEDKRSKDYLIDLAKDQTISDEYLDPGWYRPFSANGDKIPTSPPGKMVFPIWINGTLPTSDDGNVSREACVQTENDICEESIHIGIRNCGGYYIYFLQETLPNSSFCFGSGPVHCPIGTSSETGFYPGCSSSYPLTHVPVAVQAELLEGRSFQIPGYDPTPSLLPVFRCKFDEGSNETCIYDIYWYMNGFKITSYTNIPMKDMNTILLKHTDWIDRYKMNMEPEKYEYTFIEGEFITISFKSTVPVGCVASNKELITYCDQSFYAFQPTKNQNFGSWSKHIAMKDIIFKAHFCGITFGTTDWQDEKKLEVYGFSDGPYNSKFRSAYVRLSTSLVSILNEMWQSVKIPDIKVCAMYAIKCVEVIMLIVDNSKSYSSNWEVNKASVARKTRAASGLHMAEESTKTIIALTSSFGVIGVVICVLALLLYLKHKNSEAKIKVGVYWDSYQETGKHVENVFLSNLPKIFKENTISDLDIYIEDGRNTSVAHFKKQLPQVNYLTKNL